MKTVYFIRHGQPDFPGGVTHCLGQAELHLSRMGRLQGALCGAYFRENPLRVFTSPLTRAVQTAQSMGLPFEILHGLQERGMGILDGLSFQEIRSRYPELYAMRGIDPHAPIPGSESETDALERFEQAIYQGLSLCEAETPVFITHAGVLGLLLDQLQPQEKPPYGSILTLQWDGKRLLPGETAVLPRPPLTERLCLRMLQSIYTPPPVVKHGQAVADKALELCMALEQAGHPINREETVAAAWLHDICRTEPEHPCRGSELLEELGYGNLGRIISMHHSPEAAREMDEAAVVFLADKLVLESVPVTLKERFAASRQRCKTQDALEKHQTLWEAACRIAGKINTICGYAVVEMKEEI